MIEARNLTKRFGDKMALSDVSFTVPACETLCFLGANGAGKTTTINLFLGFLTPTSGSAWVAGRDVASDAEAARGVTAYIPEQVALYPELTGFENLKFFASLGGRDIEEAELVAGLEAVGLESDSFHQPAASYSKGMRQKVGIAIALAKRARVLLLDEPMSGLDPKAASDFCELLRAMNARDVAILMATHDLFRAREVGHRLGILRAGELVEVVDAAAVTGRELESLYLAHMSNAIEAVTGEAA